MLECNVYTVVTAWTEFYVRIKRAQIPKLLIAVSGASQHVKTVSLSVTSYIHRVQIYKDKSSEWVSEWVGKWLSEWVSFWEVYGEITALPVKRAGHRADTCACQCRLFSYWWAWPRFCGESFLLRSISPLKRGLHSLRLHHRGSVGQMIWIFCGWVMVCGLLLKNGRKWRTRERLKCSVGL